MTPSRSPEALERLAHKRAAAKLGWIAHATVYLLVNLALFAISEHAFGNRSWSLVSPLVWGLGLALHAVSVFALGNGSGLREHLVQKERERLQREHQRPQP
jgi:hypothetical protein